MKKVLLGVSFLGMITFFLSSHLFKIHSTICKFVDTERDYYDTCELTASLTVIFIPIFIFSLLFLFSKKEDLFKFWKRFTFIYLFIYLFILLFVTPSQGDFLAPSRDDASWFLSICYFVLALFFCLFKKWELVRIKKGKHLASWLKWLLLFCTFIAGFAVTIVIVNIDW